MQFKMKIIPRLNFRYQYWWSEGGNVTINYVLYGMEGLAQNVRDIQVPDSGRWIPEEPPDFVIKCLIISLMVILLILVNKY
jgi:hypothetical protein